MRHRLFQLSLGALVLGACLLVVVPSQPLAEALRAPLAAAASRALGTPVRIGRLQLAALPPGLSLEDVEVGTPTAPDGSPSALYARLARLQLQPHVLSLWHRRLVLGVLRLEDAAVSLTVSGPTPSADADAPEGAQASAGEALRRRLALPIDLHRAEVRRLQVTVRLPQGEFTSGDVTLDAYRPRIGRRIFSLTLPEARFLAATRGPMAQVDTPVALTATAELRGPWTQPRQLLLHGLQLQLAAMGATVHAEGAVPLAGARPSAPLQGVVRLQLEADALASALGAAGWQGQLALTASANGTWAAPEAQLEGVGNGLRRLAPGAAAVSRAKQAPAVPAVTPVGGAVLALQGHWRPGHLRLARVALAVDEGGAHQGGVTASGELDGAGRLPFKLRTQWHGARVEQLAALVGAPLPTLALGLRGEADVEGSVRPRQSRATLRLQVEDFCLSGAQAPSPHGAAAPAPGDKPAPAPKRPTTLAMDALGVTGGVHLDANGLRLEGVELHRRGASIGVEGTLQPDVAGAPGELALQLWAGGLPLQALGPIAELPYAGVASFGGTVAGPWNRPRVEAALKVDGLRVGPIGFGEAEGVLRFAAPTLQLLRFEAHRGGGTLHGEGAISFGRGRHAVALGASLADWDAADVLDDFAVPQAVGEALDARLWGKVSLHGFLDRPSGDFALRLPQLRLGPLGLGPAELQGTLSNGDAWIEAGLTAHPPAGGLGVQVGIYDGPSSGGRAGPRRGGQRLRLGGQIDALPLAQLLAPAADEGTPGIAGELTARLDAEGALRTLGPTLGGTLLADVERLQLGGAELGGAHLLAQAKGGGVALDVRLLQGAARLAAQVALAAPHATQAHLALESVDVGVLRPWLAPPGSVLDGVTAKLTAHGDVHGALDAPLAMAGELSLTQVQLGLGGTRLQLQAPVTLRLGGARLEVPTTVLADREVQVRLRGAVPLRASDALDVRCEADGDLRGLRGLLPGVLDAHGPLQLRLQLRGAGGRPQLVGELALHNAQLRLADARGQLLEELEFVAAFNGRAVAVSSAKARLGRGRLRLTGEVSLGGAEGGPADGELGLRLQLTQVPLAPTPDLSATVTGGLELGGKLDAPMLRGELRLAALRYTARLDLNALVPRRAAPPLKAPLSPWGRPVHLAVKLRAPGDLVVSSKVLEAELAADLLVTGTSERVGLLGSITPLWAKARYNENLFTLSHATVDFTDEYRISPAYSVQAHTRACQMEADVLLQGDVDGYTVQPSGRDEHGTVDPQDVLSCLNFGLRLSDFNGNRAGSAGGKDALLGSLDALWSVSGLDDKLRNLLPVRVDELRVTSGWSSYSLRTTPRVVVGKALGQKLGLRYSRSIDEYNDQAFSLEYRVQPRTTLQANWLSTPNVPVGDFGLDLQLHWELR